MGKNQTLQLHQFEVNKDNILDKTIYVYAWPKNLYKLLSEKATGYKLNKAIRNLSEAITMVIDDVIYTRSRIDQDGKQWIFAIERIDTKMINSIIKEWIIETKTSGIELSEIQFEDPIAIKTSKIIEETDKGDLINLIPHLYKMEFCKHLIDVPAINQELEFFPVIDTDKDAVAISNTFDCPVSKFEVERYSYAVTFKLVYNCEYPEKLFLNIYTGIKIWVCRSAVNPEKKTNYISGQFNSRAYCYKENDYTINGKRKLLSIKYTRDNARYFKYPTFSDGILVKLFNIDIQPAILDPNRFSDFKVDSLDEVILLTNYGRSEKVKYGAGLPERMDIFKAVRKLFPKLIKRELIHVSNGNIKFKFDKKKALSEIKGFNEAQDYSEYIDNSKDRFFYESPPICIPKNELLVIEIYSDNMELTNAFIEFTVRILSLQMPIDKYTYKSCDGYEVRFVPKSSYIARGLSDDEQKDKKIRYNEIKLELNKDDYKSNHVLSFIDIEAFHVNENTKNQDPKKVIRNVFKDQERVTQFINDFNPEETVDRIRLANAAYDLYSAAGFMDYDYMKCGLSGKVLLGLSATVDSMGKFIVLSKIEEGQVTFKVYGLWDKSWLPLEKLLPKISWYKFRDMKGLKSDRDKFNQWIVNQLNQLELENKECSFMFDASLRSKFWSFAGNTKLDINELRLLEPEKFQFIRVNVTDEIPDYNIFKNDEDSEGLNRNQGLFTQDSKVFYSVGARAVNLGVKLEATKLTHTNKHIGKQKMVEFVILSDDIDNNIIIAEECHALRKMNLTFDESTKYPLPIYVINRFGEYLRAL